MQTILRIFLQFYSQLCSTKNEQKSSIPAIMLSNVQSYSDMWQTCLDRIKAQTSAEEFEKWFRPIVPLTFDGTKAVSLTEIRRIPASQENLLSAMPEKAAIMERELKAIIQQYMARMLQDRLVPENDKQ